MGIDGSEYPLCRNRGIGSGGHVCRAGFLCKTAFGDFRVGDAIENGTRQSRAPLRAVAGTRAPAERPVSLDLAAKRCSGGCVSRRGENQEPAAVGAVVVPESRDEMPSLPPARCCNGTNVPRSTADVGEAVLSTNSLAAAFSSVHRDNG